MDNSCNESVYNPGTFKVLSSLLDSGSLEEVMSFLNSVPDPNNIFIYEIIKKERLDVIKEMHCNGSCISVDHIPTAISYKKMDIFYFLLENNTDIATFNGGWIFESIYCAYRKQNISALLLLLDNKYKLVSVNTDEWGCSYICRIMVLLNEKSFHSFFSLRDQDPEVYLEKIELLKQWALSDADNCSECCEGCKKLYNFECIQAQSK